MEHDNTSRPDLQIIGGGLAGLLAANLAADAGLTVRLIERQPSPGGRAATDQHHGYALNRGPHALYLEGELRRHLLALGLDPAGVAPELAGATGSVAGRVGLLPTGPAAVLRSRLLSAGSKAALARIMTGITRRDPSEVASLTVDQWLDGLTSRSDLRAVLWGLTNLVTYNAASDQASADAAIAQFQMTDGVRYVDGGWASIVGALVERADRLGVTRVTARVTAVEADPGAGAGSRPGSDPGAGAGVDAGSGSSPIVVVTDDGSRLAAATCLIAAGGPAVADRLLGLGTHHADRAGPPVEASVLDLGLRTRPEVGVHLGLDSALYATLHSVAGGLAPTGRHLVSLARYRRPGDNTDPDQTRQLLLDHARAMGIDPATIEVDRYLHSLTVTAGMPLAERGGLAGRPPAAVTDRPGVYVAGDWVGPRGLLADAAAASAADAVTQIASRIATRAATGRMARGTALAPADGTAQARPARLVES